MRGPRVETRGYSLTSLTGLTLGAPLISGPNPGLFSVAPLGLQEQARVAGDGFFPPLLSPAGGLSKNLLDIYVHFCYNDCMGH